MIDHCTIDIWDYWDSTIIVTVHKKTRYNSEIAILDNTHLKAQTLCYFMLKSDLSNLDRITFV